MNNRTFIKLALAGIAAFSISAQALQFDLTTPLPGQPSPSGSAPWLTVGLADQADMTVLLTLTAHLQPGEKIDFVTLNFDPSQNPAGIFNPSWSDPILQSVTLGKNIHALPGDGLFDILLQFDNRSGTGFDNNDSISLLLSPLTGMTLNAAMFDYPSEQHSANEYFGYKAGAHVLGLPNEGSTSIVPGKPVPEAASTLGLMGLALLGLTAVRRRC